MGFLTFHTHVPWQMCSTPIGAQVWSLALRRLFASLLHLAPLHNLMFHFWNFMFHFWNFMFHFWNFMFHFWNFISFSPFSSNFKQYLCQAPGAVFLNSQLVCILGTGKNGKRIQLNEKKWYWAVWDEMDFEMEQWILDTNAVKQLS